jgi:HEAT repeat protein
VTEKKGRFVTTSALLLDDAAMRRFIIDGYLVLKPEFSADFHDGIYQRLEKVLAGGNPGNNLLPRVPELQRVLDHPMVHGALRSILGPDYYLHLHRHVHDNPPGSKGQSLHKDSLYNSRFAVDEKRRHHRTRWLMLFYYPQDTPVELGPTAIMPRSQYLNTERPAGTEELPLSGEAGTVTIVHYDLLHRGMANTSDKMRYMAKFLFTRMTEPRAPSWNHRDPTWETTGDPQETIWRHLWDWHRGVADNLDPATEQSVAVLAARLRDETEINGLSAAYELGTRGEEAVPILIEALKDEREAAPRNAAYGFNAIGEAAVPALLETARDAEPKVRARALDILGDMGLAAAGAVPDLIGGLRDEADDPRRRAAEALGTAGQASLEIAEPLGNALQEDPSAEVRRNAALSLARLGPQAAEAVPALAQGMMDENHYVRGFSVYALSRIGTAEATQVVVKHLQTMRWDWA